MKEPDGRFILMRKTVLALLIALFVCTPVSFAEAPQDTTSQGQIEQLEDRIDDLSHAVKRQAVSQSYFSEILNTQLAWFSAVLLFVGVVTGFGTSWLFRREIRQLKADLESRIQEVKRFSTESDEDLSDRVRETEAEMRQKFWGEMEDLNNSISETASELKAEIQQTNDKLEEKAKGLAEGIEATDEAIQQLLYFEFVVRLTGDDYIPTFYDLTQAATIISILRIRDNNERLFTTLQLTIHVVRDGEFDKEISSITKERFIHLRKICTSLIQASEPAIASVASKLFRVLDDKVKDMD